mgnify:CR=1 FL=1
MSELRARERPAEGPAAVWDPADPGDFTRLAGSQLVRVDGDTAWIRTGNGGEMPVYPGWLVILPDGAGDGQAVFTTPEQAEILD